MPKIRPFPLAVIRSRSLVLPWSLLAVVSVACSSETVEVIEIGDSELAIFKIESKYPGDNEVTPDKVALGRRLYHDKSLSKGGDISCASCHGLDTYGVDNKPKSPGTGGVLGGRNTPSSLNAFRQFRQFWDGREATVEDQAIGPVLNPKEHGVKDEAELVSMMKRDAETVAMFKKAFPGAGDPVTAKNFGKAVGAFERKLVTRSPWDEFLDGKKDALTNAQKRGLKEFIAAGCTTCHFGRTLGGQMYNKLGLVRPYEGSDKGRFEVTKKKEDEYFFKVPSLLNVAKTGPYLHDGSIESLAEMVRKMGSWQRGIDLTDAQVKSIVAFLGAMTGELPPEIQAPK